MFLDLSTPHDDSQPRSQLPDNPDNISVDSSTDISVMDVSSASDSSFVDNSDDSFISVD